MNKRINIFKYLIFILFFIITIRLFSLQVVNRNYYNSLLNSKKVKMIKREVPRGKIYDTNNNLLVDNKLQLMIVYQSDASFKEKIELAYTVSEYLELDYNKLSNSFIKDFYILTNEKSINKRISEDEYNKFKNGDIDNNGFYKLKKDKVIDSDLNYNEKDKKAIYLYYLMTNGYTYQNKIIKDNCTMEEFMFFSEYGNNLDGFSTMYSYEREYLYGDTVKSVLGRVGDIPKENLNYYLNKGYEMSDKVGLSSLELIYDDYLKGEKETYKIIGNEKYLVKDGKCGNDIVLTIDINLQKYVDQILSEEIIKAKSVYSTKYYNHSYIVISDTYGRVLTMSGKEYFNGKTIDRSIGNITDTMAPGSSVKGVSMLVGYDTGAIKIGEVIKDECLKIKDTPEKCSFRTMGNINDITALRRSSNVYQFKIAIKVGKGIYRKNYPLILNNEAFATYRDYFNRFGLGISTKIDLLNESTGYKGTNKLSGLLLDFAIGQYDTYTTMQMNQYISTLAQKGNRYKMNLLKLIKDNTKVLKEIKPQVLNNVNIDEKYINRVIDGFREVINSGTGYGYVNLSYKAAGKTGTSDTFMDTNNDNQIDKTSTSTSFVMFMPYNNPKIAISMMSPNLSYTEAYPYSLDRQVIRRITDNIYNFIK